MVARMGEHVVALSTVPDAETAVRLARTLVSERLAACVNILPVSRSVYEWQGQLREEAEVLCIIKTRRDLFARLCARWVGLHPYQVPELVALDVQGGHAPYLSWMDAQTRTPTETDS